MPTLDLTHAQLGHLYDAAGRGIADLDEQLGDCRAEQFYSAADWAKMHKMRDRWAKALEVLASAIEETANAND
jgi:hypothetical protein